MPNRFTDYLTTRLGKIVDRLLCNWFNERRPVDYERLAYFVAAQQSADFFVANMRLAQNLIGKRELLEFALGEVDAPGLWLEFGVARGKDIRAIAGSCPHTVYGFDSFLGLPEDWTHFQRQGRFSTGGHLPAGLPENVMILKGLFEDTLPSFLHEHPEKIAFLHLDSDLYSSTRQVLGLLHGRLQPGTIILFDDFMNYPGWLEGEAKAWFECVAEHAIEFRYIGFASRHHSVAIRICAAERANTFETILGASSV